MHTAHNGRYKYYINQFKNGVYNTVVGYDGRQ